MAAITKAAVIGAGTMGAGIASHLANAGVSVVLLDLVPEGAENRNQVAETAIDRLLAATPPAFMDRSYAARITPGNVEDHLDQLAQVDWIAEAVVERLEVKQALYRRIESLRRPGTPVSSNTSTIPLSLLTEGMPARLAPDFCITHFFNPVRYMRLLEMVAGPDTRPEVIEALADFCDRRLGKGVVRCKDTPGFLANRVGCFALQAAMVEALELGLTVEEADSIMGRPMGIPKTGVFGLYDLIGLDLMLDVCRTLSRVLPADDAFLEVAQGIPITHKLVAEGRTGRKGGGGFYRSALVNGTPIREAVDLESGLYRPARRRGNRATAMVESGGLGALIDAPDAQGRFAWRVLARTLSYAASLVPEVTEDPADIDEAMKLGYNWSQGPFEMIDALGADRFRTRLEAEGRPVPAFLEATAGRSLYRANGGHLHSLSADGTYRKVARAPGVIRLGEVTRVSQALLSNDAAGLWDVGEGVACLEFHTKANALVPDSLSLLHRAVERAERDFAALVIHSDTPHFSVGVNLGFVLAAAKARDWHGLEQMLLDFQATCLALRKAAIPVVGAPVGMALGGGFEILLHCDAVQAHANTTLGLVETLVGLIPSGGGCKEMLRRWRDGVGQAFEVSAAQKAFHIIAGGQMAGSPEQARPLRFLLARDHATMNRDRLLAEARARALELAADYTPPPAPHFRALDLAALDSGSEERLAEGQATPHDLVVRTQLARVLSGGDRKSADPLSEEEVLDLEREAFLHLVGTPATLARIAHMLEHGRPLRN